MNSLSVSVRGNADASCSAFSHPERKTQHSLCRAFSKLANQRAAAVVGCTGACYPECNSASIISLQRAICLDKYWFCVGPCNGTLCRQPSP